jgi:hypothetical protein
MARRWDTRPATAAERSRAAWLRSKKGRARTRAESAWLRKYEVARARFADRRTKRSKRARATGPRPPSLAQIAARLARFVADWLGADEQHGETLWERRWSRVWFQVDFTDVVFPTVSQLEPLVRGDFTFLRPHLYSVSALFEQETVSDWATLLTLTDDEGFAAAEMGVALQELKGIYGGRGIGAVSALVVRGR